MHNVFLFIIIFCLIDISNYLKYISSNIIFEEFSYETAYYGVDVFKIYKLNIPNSYNAYYDILEDVYVIESFLSTNYKYILTVDNKNKKVTEEFIVTFVSTESKKIYRYNNYIIYINKIKDMWYSIHSPQLNIDYIDKNLNQDSEIVIRILKLNSYKDIKLTELEKYNLLTGLKFRKTINAKIKQIILQE